MSLSTERVQFENALAAIFAGFDAGAGTITPTRQVLIDYVKAKLDEVIPGGEGTSFSLSSAPNISNPLDLLINSHLEEGTKDICLNAPLSVLFPVTDTIVGVVGADTKTGYIVLPDNFLRLSRLKMTDWTKELTGKDLITPENFIYKSQFIKWSCNRGTPSKPVAVLNWKTITAVSKKIIEYFCVDTYHTVDKFLYIPEMLAEDFITVNPNLMDALAWQIAGKIMQITGMIEPAKMAQERVLQSLNYKP
jgi:hypothetical protein